jgi:hypothetical protein
VKTKCPAGCGKKFIDNQSAENPANKMHQGWREPKSRGWVTPYGFADFREPVAYEHACEIMAKLNEKINKRTENKDG